MNEPSHAIKPLDGPEALQRALAIDTSALPIVSAWPSRQVLARQPNIAGEGNRYSGGDDSES